MKSSQPPLLRDVEGGVLVSVTVVAGARRTEHTFGDTGLKVRLAAPPVDGKANEELIRYLADQLQIPRSRLAIVRGLTDRRKSILVAMPRAELETKSLFFRD